MGHIEHDIRLLEDVVACQITPTEVIVLVKPGADPEAVSAAVNTILVGAAAGRELKVLGGTPAAGAVVHRRRAAVLAGTAGAAVLAAATVAAAVSGAFDREPAPHRPEIAAGPVTSVARNPRVRGNRVPLSPGLGAVPTTTPGAAAPINQEPTAGARTLPETPLPLPVSPPAVVPVAPVAPVVPVQPPVATPPLPVPPAPIVPVQPPSPLPAPDNGYPLQPPSLTESPTPAVVPVVVRVPLPAPLVDSTPPSPAPAPVPAERQLAGTDGCASDAPPWGRKAKGRGPAGHGRWSAAGGKDCTSRVPWWRHGRKSGGDGGNDA